MDGLLVFVNNDFCHSWGDSAMIFTRDENHCRIASRIRFNDFLSRVRRFGNDFHEWRSHERKSLPNRIRRDKKSLFTITNVLLYFLHAILCPEHTFTLKTLIDRWFRQMSLKTVFSDLALWRHHSWSVTSRERVVLTLWRHIRRLFLHAQIWCKGDLH